MSRTIPIALQAHLNQPATTVCRLLRIDPVLGDSFGFCSTNRSLTYDDGISELTYRTMSGFDLSALVSTADTGVDNSEAMVLLLAGGPLTAGQLEAGVLDGAEFTIYEVNYNDLSMGHYVVQHGYVGRTKVKRGAAFTLELRSLVDLLRQEPWEKWQRLCRVRQFGSQPGDERFPCMYDLSSEWVEGVAVTSVGVETNRTFTASSLGQVANYFAPGMVLWLTGQNAGLSYEIESFGSGGVISLGFPTIYPISASDTFDIRRDCTREWEGHNSCETYNNRLNYRGEPKTRPAEIASVLVQGADVPPGSGGTTYQPPEETVTP